MILYDNEHRVLTQIVNSRSNKSQVVLVTGDFGKGKSTLINQALKMTTRETVNVKHYKNKKVNEPYQPLSSAIQKMIDIGKCEKRINNSELCHRDYLLKQFIQIFRKNPRVITIFSDLRDYDESSVSLIREILEYTSEQEIPCCVILEYSTNDLSPAEYDQLLSLEKLCTCQPIKLHSKNMEIFEKYFVILLDGSCNIETDKIDKIIKEALYNPAVMEKMIHCFKEKGIFYQQQGGYWYCDRMDFYLTRKFFEEDIKKRYDDLDSKLRSYLEKASITGYEIDVDLMSYPLQVIKTEENLKRIELLSRLITHIDHQYFFENESAYDFIHDGVNDSDKIKLHLLVADHLCDSLIKFNRKKREDSSYLSGLGVAKSHFIEALDSGCEDVDHKIRTNIFRLLSLYIHYAYEQRNYEAVLLSIDEFCKRVKEDEYQLETQFFLRLKSSIETIQGRYDIACETLCNINSQLFHKKYNYYLKYERAYCLFHLGICENAIALAEDIIREFEQNDLREPYLQIKVCTLLSGMYHHVGNSYMAERSYEQAWELSYQHRSYQREHNRLLTISNMLYVDDIAVEQIEKCIRYYGDNKQLQSQGQACNNVAVSYIYLNKLDDASDNLKKSINNFSEYCSTSVHYPQNNLGTIYALQRNYDSALELFKSAKRHHVEQFSELWISINIAHCERLTGDLSLCRQILESIKFQIENMQEDTLFLERNICIAFALLELDENKPEMAYNNLLRALDIELNHLSNDTYPIYISKLLLEISEKSGMTLPDLAKPFVSSFVNPYIRNLLESRVHWGHLFFWEL